MRRTVAQGHGRGGDSATLQWWIGINGDQRLASERARLYRAGRFFSDRMNCHGERGYQRDQVWALGDKDRADALCRARTAARHLNLRETYIFIKTLYQKPQFQVLVWNGPGLKLKLETRMFVPCDPRQDGRRRIYL